ncbi:MAG: hypothetical protein UV00_C0005G0022 [candidate division WWE3 bacterium GW2011_GWF1_42_14]|uniref:Cytoplasmic protein n=2 Tax=Katanobacteria TaxID=422282 RepID=A0A0G0YQG2_UNCKA|nr:MAG: hypothetical protein UU92_C0006G0036 [candidate division WWE3 bacterium GW2011_GWA1_42_12]KKS34387.1 MAG: hypothetical protein UU97_C0011G0023 [candidate division WWE3 bacterium GW2011_GWD1_42_14]KKS38839.1 MAG: hypothetical protein UV00_C0005G0022 [candidate division WWE3 bacterium GW2011_GWF1_42_14]KKS40537.1 MAG: hypothetical protein UV03_C0005G0023 [candidate division WWE3 bacterium GW2011_GWE1_42_16]KKS66954.1 MAG: hypothetical protein UV35_C0005G0035 [candidate division WWE3 bacte
MPYFDRTGPQGQGPMTGRGMGPCGGDMGFGRRGFGRGYGRGLRSWFASPTKAQIKEGLAQYRKDLENELEQVKAEQKGLEEEK